MRVKSVLTLTAALSFLIWTGSAMAWPRGTVTIIVPFSMGDHTDRLFSLFQTSFQQVTDQPMILEHVSGRGGADAWARFDPGRTDGMVLTGISIPHIFLRSWQPGSGISMEDMRVVAIVCHTPAVLWVPEESPYQDIDALVFAARVNPGAILLGGSGSASTDRLASLALDRLSGTRSGYVPYADSLAAREGAKKGDVQAVWATAMAVPGFRALAVAAPGRIAPLPHTPTFREKGYDLVEGTYIGLAAPADCEPEMLTIMENTLIAVTASPDFVSESVTAGFEPIVTIPGKTAAYLEQLREGYRIRAEDFDLVAR